MMTRPAAVAVALLAACRTSAPPDVIPSRQIIEIGPRDGAVSAELLPDSDAPAVKLGPDEEFVPAHLFRSNQPPEYPRDLLESAVPRHVIAVRVVFDENGRVMSVAESPLVPSTSGEYAAHFEAAVRRAVAAWRCSPAEIRKFRDGADLDGDGKADYRVMTDRRVLKTFFDLSFTFAVVNGQPMVKSSTSD